MTIDYLHRLNPIQIWNIKQNKPTLIARDLQKYGVPIEVSYSILLGRGVFKWLAVRRDLIRLKNAWKERITIAIGRIRKAKQTNDYGTLMYQRGYLRAYEEARAEIRLLCHSQRFRAPDFDMEAQRFLENIGQVKEYSPELFGRKGGNDGQDESGTDQSSDS